MAEPMTDETLRCPWCSSELPSPEAATCPSCGATLTSVTGTEPQLPGVTTLDPEAILRGKTESSRPRSRLLSFITGETPEEPATDASPESLAPPSEAVRREILRLEIDAARIELEAAQAEALAEAGIAISPAGEPPAEAEAPAEGSAPADTADADVTADATADEPRESAGPTD